MNYPCSFRGIFFYYQSTNLHEALGIVSQSDAIEREKASQKGGYIYVSSEEEDSNKSSNHEQKSEHSKNYLKYRERNRKQDILTPQFCHLIS